MAWTSIVIYGCVIFQLCFAFGWIVLAGLDEAHRRETLKRSHEDTDKLKQMIGKGDLN